MNFEEGVSVRVGWGVGGGVGVGVGVTNKGKIVVGKKKEEGRVLGIEKIIIIMGVRGFGFI